MGQNQSKLWPTFVRPVFIITESDKPELEFDSESEFESDSDAASFHYPSTHAALMPVPRKIPAKLPDGFLSLTSIRGLVVRSGAAQPWAYGTNYPTSWSDELRELWDGKRLLVKHDGYYGIFTTYLLRFLTDSNE